MSHYSSMKKSKLIIIPLISLTLTSCNLFNLFGKETPKVRNNAFFTEKELSNYFVSDLPTFEQTEDSRLEIYKSHLEGYFNVNNPGKVLKEYSTQTFEYFKNSDHKYGAMLQNATGWFIDSFKTYECLRNVKTFDFYRIYSDRYAFFYEKEHTFYEVLVKTSNKEINNKTYNFLIEINELGRGIRGWATEYEEVILTNDNVDEYIDFKWSVSRSGIHFEFISPKPLYDYRHFTYVVNYTFRGESDTYTFGERDNGGISEYYPYILMFSNVFEDDSYRYQEGDFVVNSTEIIGEGAVIAKKGESKLPPKSSEPTSEEPTDSNIE